MISLVIIFTIFIINLVIVLLFKRKKIIISVPVWLLPISVFIAMIGFVLVTWQNGEINTELEKRTWAITEGKIIESEIVGKRAIRAEVVYQYKIKNKYFQGNSDYNIPGFGSKNYRRKTASIVKNQNQIGSIVKVYYDSLNPKNSTLRHGPYWSNYMIIGFGGILCLIGMFGFLWWLLIIKFKIEEK